MSICGVVLVFEMMLHLDTLRQEQVLYYFIQGLCISTILNFSASYDRMCHSITLIGDWILLRTSRSIETKNLDFPSRLHIINEQRTWRTNFANAL
jgi:hypothetical protein